MKAGVVTITLRAIVDPGWKRLAAWDRRRRTKKRRSIAEIIRAARDARRESVRRAAMGIYHRAILALPGVRRLRTYRVGKYSTGVEVLFWTGELFASNRHEPPRKNFDRIFPPV